MAQDTLLGFPAHTLPFRCGESTSFDSLKARSKERAFCFCSQVRSRRRMGRMYLKAAVL